MLDLLNMDFEALRNVDIHTVSPDDLVNLEDIVIHPDDPQEQKLIDFLLQVKNPYLFKCGDTIVKVNYLNNGYSLTDKMKSFFLSL